MLPIRKRCRPGSGSISGRAIPLKPRARRSPSAQTSKMRSTRAIGPRLRAGAWEWARRAPCFCRKRVRRAVLPDVARQQQHHARRVSHLAGIVHNSILRADNHPGFGSADRTRPDSGHRLTVGGLPARRSLVRVWVAHDAQQCAEVLPFVAAAGAERYFRGRARSLRQCRPPGFVRTVVPD